MAAHKDTNGTWYYRFDAPRGPDGSRRRIVRRGFRTKKAATDAEDIARGEALRGHAPPPASLTVADLLRQWLEYQQSRRDQGALGRATYDSYERWCRTHLVPGLGNVKLAALNAHHIERYLSGAAYARLPNLGGKKRMDPAKDLPAKDAGKPKALSARAVQIQFRILSMACRRGVRWRMLPRNPCEDVDPPGSPVGDPKSLDAEAARRVLGEVEGTWLYLPVFLAMCAGLRRGEVCGLRWTDLDLTAGTMTVRTSIEQVGGVLTEGPPKAGHAETIALPSNLVDELRLRKALSVSEWVVSEDDGSMTHPDRVTSRWRRFRRAKRLEIGFHGLRHTYGSVMTDAGVHPFVAMRQMRHASVPMTEHYSKVRDPAQIDAARRVGELLRKDHQAGGGEGVGAEEDGQ